MHRLRAGRPRGRLRVIAAVVAALAVLGVTQAFLPLWAATIVGLVIGVLGSGFQRTSEQIARRVAGDAALTASVVHDANFVGDGWIVALHGDLVGEKSPLEGSSVIEAHSHLMRHGSYDVGMSHLRLTLQNNSSSPVAITAVDAVVCKRELAVSDVRVRAVGAGAIDVTTLRIRLDDRLPKLRDRKGRDYFRRHAVSLIPGESHVFTIHAVAKKAAFVWELEVCYTAGGEPAAIRLPAGRTTAAAPRYARSYEWVWYEVPQRVVPRSAANAAWP